jgi:cytochrome c biogenesis protein ResB
MLDDGAFLHLAGQTPSHYGVTLQISDGEKELELPISINHPAGYKGWRFYLTSYDQRSRSYVVLSARRDPGRGTVIAGIWIVMIGTFVLCFRKTSIGGVESRRGFQPRSNAKNGLINKRGWKPRLQSDSEKGMEAG